MRKFLGLSIAQYVIVSIGLGVWNSAWGDVVVVTGRAVDEDGQPVSTATVAISAVAKPLLLTPEPVRADGSFSVKIQYQSRSPVQAEMSAPGFVATTKNFVLSGSGKQDISTFVLKRSATLKLGRPEVLVSANGTEVFLDVYMSNESKSSLELRTFRVLGTAVATTGCLDSTPARTFKITTFLPTGKLAVATIQDEKMQPLDSVLPQGGVEILPCGQCRIDVTVPMLASLGAGKQEKLRFTIPRLLQVKGGTCKPFEDWAALNISVLSDGVEVRSPRTY